MTVVVTCVVLAVLGLVALVRWHGVELAPSPAPERRLVARRAPVAALSRYAWWATLVTVGAVGGALLAGGPGLRLVMRLLALTSPEADGLTTEAGATIGQVTVGGTLALVVFGALPTSFAFAAVYLALHRWLPGGWRGGLVLAVGAVVVAGTRMDPLRPGNADFDLVGPGWLAVIGFTAVAAASGALVAVLTAWYSHRLPALTAERRTWRPYAPLLLAVVVVPLGIVLLVGAVLSVLLDRLPAGPRRWWESGRVRAVGRALLALGVLAGALPFGLDVAELVGD